MITPTVIENVQDARDFTEDYKERFQGLKPLQRLIEPAPGQGGER